MYDILVLLDLTIISLQNTLTPPSKHIQNSPFLLQGSNIYISYNTLFRTKLIQSFTSLEERQGNFNLTKIHKLSNTRLKLAVRMTL